MPGTYCAIYSAATTAVGLGTAVTNEATKIGSGDFSSLKDFFGSLFGGSSINPSDLGVMNIVPGGCMGPSAPTLPGQSAPGTGSGAPGGGAPPKPGTAGAPDGNASGEGKDGMLVTTKQGNPAAAIAAIEAQFRKDNNAALEKAQAEEKAAQEKAAQQKAAKDKAAKDKAAKDKAAKDKAAKDNAANATSDTSESKAESDFHAWWETLTGEPVMIPGTETPLIRGPLGRCQAPIGPFFVGVATVTGPSPLMTPTPNNQNRSGKIQALAASQILAVD